MTDHFKLKRFTRVQDLFVYKKTKLISFRKGIEIPKRSFTLKFSSVSTGAYINWYKTVLKSQLDK